MALAYAQTEYRGPKNRFIVTTVGDGTDKLEVWYDTVDGNGPESLEQAEMGGGNPFLVLDQGTGGEREAASIGEVLALGFHLLQQNCASRLVLNGFSVGPESMEQTGGSGEIGPEDVVRFDGLKMPLSVALSGPGHRLELDKTRRGFAVAEFTDLYGARCSLQESSLATKDAVWLGVDTDMNNGDLTHGRMHLDRGMAARLIPLLVNFVQTGTLEPRPWAPGDGPAPEAEAAPTGQVTGYVIRWSTPYEGESSEEFNTYAEVLEWVSKNGARYAFSLDNLTLYPKVQSIDLYKVVAGEISDELPPAGPPSPKE